MKAVEEYKPELEGVLPKDEYSRLTRDEKTKTIPTQLLKNFANIPADFTGDLFGQIYEYFLAEFARSEGSRTGVEYSKDLRSELARSLSAALHGSASRCFSWSPVIQERGERWILSFREAKF
jgi:hypothetical protein